MEEKKLQEVADVVLDILWEKLTAEYGEEKTRSVLFENYDSGENYGTVYILPDILNACLTYEIEPGMLDVQEVAARHYDQIEACGVMERKEGEEDERYDI